MELLRFLLYPFAVIYGLVVFLRNKLFDWRILKSHSFPFPVISVGNMVAGGSGKTPLVEYLIRFLKPGYTISTLSRGYGRKTKGFRLANPSDTIDKLGDEPLQYSRKFPEITVSVDESRKHGIRQLMAEVQGLEAVILDDAFQHRYVKPGLSILVTDYHKIFTLDHLLPVGKLREWKSGSKRANIIVVSKTPRIFSPLVRRQLLEDLKPHDHQLVCFSFIDYEDWIPLYSQGSEIDLESRKVTTILLVTGIAFPAPMEEYLRPFCSDLIKLEFGDHHNFTDKDLALIRDTFLTLPTRKKIIITTEKDAMRLKNPDAEAILSEFPFFYLPIRFKFHPQDKEAFEQAIAALMKKKKLI
ncbi:MAG: tetraacyldisaccharide 4'-kinase [Bacteroidetes bacterium]|nr:tetraacyldisaccharide 4'-kinase [Bacteroidota bacterium]